MSFFISEFAHLLHSFSHIKLKQTITEKIGIWNEGGLERTSRGLVTREAVCRLLPDVFLIPGALKTKWDSWHRNALFVLFLQKKRFYVE